MDQQPVYLGVDGGATWTRAMVCDGKANVLGWSVGAPSNHQGLGLQQAIANIDRIVIEALAMAGLSHVAVRRAYFALAGDDTIDDEQMLSAALVSILPAARFSLGNDLWAALRGGTSQPYGVVINCASGSGAAGIGPDGRTVIIPDLGYDFGDWGSGTEIGVEAFRAVIRAWDGRDGSTMLTQLILDLAGLSSVDELYMARYREQIGRNWMARCTALVFQASALGDAVATSILQRVGTELARTASAVVRRLEIAAATFTVVLAGGAIRTLESALIDAFRTTLYLVAPHASYTLPRLPAVCGACLLALQADGPVDERHFQALEQSSFVQAAISSR